MSLNREKLIFLTGMSAGVFSVSLVASFFPERSFVLYLIALASVIATVFFNYMIYKESKVRL